MYNTRSRFTHGDFSFLPLHKSGGDLPQHEFDLEEAYKLSTLLVIATLQKMYRDDLQELNFEYSLKNYNLTNHRGCNKVKTRDLFEMPGPFGCICLP